MTYNDLCDNGCPHPRYDHRRVCKDCVAKEQKARRAKQAVKIGRGRPSSALNEDQVQQVVKLYQEGKSQKAIGAIFHLSDTTIGKYLRGKKVAMRTGAEAQKPDVSADFFPAKNKLGNSSRWLSEPVMGARV